jgi:hypothetical protein
LGVRRLTGATLVGAFAGAFFAVTMIKRICPVCGW